MRPVLCLLLFSAPALAADFPPPPPTKPDEPLAKVFSPAKAAAYLDGVGVNWTRDRGCVTCHTNLPYLMARPLLKGDDTGWTEVRKFLADQAADWADGGKPRGDAYVVVTAAGLAATDAAAGRLSEPTKQAFAKMWAVQRPSGEWNWIKCNWAPLEHDDYYGAVLAAVAVGTAPGGYADSAEAKPGLAKLRAYLAKTPAPDLHHKTVLLWASTKLPGLMTADERDKTVAELTKLQKPDGGWCLPSLGKYVRHDKTPNDPAAPSDGYATGLAVYVLRQAGLPADHPAVGKGVTWLKGNQRAGGGWFTRSLNNDKTHYIAHAGSAYAVMALAACGEPVGAK